MDILTGISVIDRMSIPEYKGYTYPHYIQYMMALRANRQLSGIPYYPDIPLITADTFGDVMLLMMCVRGKVRSKVSLFMKCCKDNWNSYFTGASTKIVQ